MTGIYEHTLDAKGRLSIPSRLRDELGSEFYVTLSFQNCLSAYSLKNWAKFEEKYDDLPREDKAKMRPLFAYASYCELDSQGRILIPPKLRDKGGLVKDITVVGAGDCAEFWDSETWAVVDAVESTQENITAMYKELKF